MTFVYDFRNLCFLRSKIRKIHFTIVFLWNGMARLGEFKRIPLSTVLLRHGKFTVSQIYLASVEFRISTRRKESSGAR